MRCYGMNDVYEKFACDYDEFGLFGWSADEKRPNHLCLCSEIC